MNTEECCNHNCNQGRDCPLRVSHRSLAEEITEGFDALKKIRELEEKIVELKNLRDYWCLQYKDVFNKLESSKDEVAMWKMSYENNIRFEDGYGHN